MSGRVTGVRHKALRQGAAVLMLGVFVACGGSQDPPSSPNPPGTPSPPGTGETITGRERIGWTQEASDAAQLATYDFAIYVDGARHVLAGDTCTGSGGGPFECSAPLPSMTPGQHTLELAAFTSSGGTILESERSGALRVTVAAATPPSESTLGPQSPVVTPDGHQFRASILARELDSPSDLAIAPDGRVFIAERAGRVRVVGPESTANVLALELDEVAASDESGLTAIALHPDFERNGFVYLAYATEERAGAAFLISRFRERGGILAQAAVVARHPAPSAQHVVARFGSDGKLYAGFGAGTDPREAQNPSSILGKIIRMNDDGSTPRDNARASAILSSGHRDPRGLMWHPSTGTMWEVERDREAGDELNSITPGRDYGWPLARGATSYARSVPAALVLPTGTEVSGASFVSSKSASPLAGELLVASRGAEDLFRIRTDSPSLRPALGEGMLQRRYGRIGAVSTSADGTIYFVTANQDLWGAGQDALVRLEYLSRE